MRRRLTVTIKGGETKGGGCTSFWTVFKRGNFHAASRFTIRGKLKKGEVGKKSVAKMMTKKALIGVVREIISSRPNRRCEQLGRLKKRKKGQWSATC